MYNDYEVTYVSKINEYQIPLLIGLVLAVLLLIVMLIATSKIFKKANRSGVSAFIPVYNSIVLFEIANKPVWQALLLLLPVGGIILNIILSSTLSLLILIITLIIGIIDYFSVMFIIAKSFRKTDMNAFATCLLPFIYVPIIGFGSSEFIGINKEAMSGKSIAVDLPLIDEKETIADEGKSVTETKSIDISIGGGVYQKEYKESLLSVNEENNNTNNLASFRVETPQPEEPIEEVKEEPKLETNLLYNINYIDPTKIKEEEKVPEIKEEEPQEIKEETQPVEKKEITDPGKCPYCGFPIKPGSTKCFMCGKDL